MSKLGVAAWAFMQTLWSTRAGRSRKSFERWQGKKLANWLKNDLPRVDYYGETPKNLGDLPIIDKKTLMANFDRFNIARVRADDGWRACETDKKIGGLNVGASTGTSGNRALFVISEAERFRWLGVMLAKAVPGFLFRRERVAVILPQDTALYDAANTTKRIKLEFYDLRAGPQAWLERLEKFSPTAIVAPPKILRYLAEADISLAPRKIFSAAETLDPADRKIIETKFKLQLGQIYMATEGLLGVSCAHGMVHLAEDSIYFEFEPVGDGLVSPIITAFARQTQIMARYRMNDLLRLSNRPCPCGSPLQGVAEIVGRMDDVFKFYTNKGEVLITPDILRNAVIDADRKIEDFRILQTGATQVELVLTRELPVAAANAARQALADLFKARQLRVTIDLRQRHMPLQTSQKLRRVENRFGHPDSALPTPCQHPPFSGPN